jgi:hypothetical protein
MKRSSLSRWAEFQTMGYFSVLRGTTRIYFAFDSFRASAAHMLSPYLPNNGWWVLDFCKVR